MACVQTENTIWKNYYCESFMHSLEFTGWQRQRITPKIRLNNINGKHVKTYRTTSPMPSFHLRIALTLNHGAKDKSNVYLRGVDSSYEDFYKDSQMRNEFTDIQDLFVHPIVYSESLAFKYVWLPKEKKQFSQLLRYYEQQKWQASVLEAMIDQVKSDIRRDQKNSKNLKNPKKNRNRKKPNK